MRNRIARLAQLAELAAALLALAIVAAAIVGCNQTIAPTTTAPRIAQLPRQHAPRRPPAARPAAPVAGDHESAQDGRQVAGGASCGRERWDVKTATDPAAASVALAPQTTTIAAVNQLQSTNTGNPDQPRQPGYESAVWRVSGTLVEARGESDSDIHLILADAQGNHLGAEIPDAPACTQPPFTKVASPLEPQMEAARAAFVQAFGTPGKYPARPLKIGAPVTVTGVGFFDFGHGQTGAASNYAELHPVIGLQVGGSTAGLVEVR